MLPAPSCFPWAAGGYPEHLGWGLSSANNPARLKNSLLQLGLELGREPWMKMLSAGRAGVVPPFGSTPRPGLGSGRSKHLLTDGLLLNKPRVFLEASQFGVCLDLRRWGLF